MVKLGEVLTERRETPSEEDLLSGRVRIVEKISFDTGRIQLRSNGSTRTGMILVRPGDLVVSGINAAKGAIAIYDPEATEPVAATIHYGAYIPKLDRVDVRYLWWMLRSRFFQELLNEYLPGGIKTELKAKRLLPVPVPLPPLSEQRRIVARIEELAAQIEEARQLRLQQQVDLQRALLGAFWTIANDAPRRPMQEVAPIMRRNAELDPNASYPELGIRSFGKGTFHKPALTGTALGSKRLYQIEPGDLLFMNVFAWEGAVAVAKPEDKGRYGSHRFITCVPRKEVITANFLCFYFLTEEGLEKLGEASPGGAGRNRTLGLTTLSKIQVPVPTMDKQQWFESLLFEVDRLKTLQAQTAAELDALLPAILDRAFKGEL
jgi:type I restriction enzyme S subunit